MTRLLIFDLDGTLVDTKKDIAVSLNHALKQEGFKPLPQAQIEALVGWGAKQLVEEALGNPSAEDLQRVFVTFLNYYEAHLMDHSFIYPGVVEFIEAQIDWEMAVVTNKPEVHSKKLLSGLGLDAYFFSVIGGDTLPTRKPDIEVLNVLRDQIGPWEQGVMVGDSIIDQQFGRDGGLLTCMLTHGFGQIQDLKNAEPDYLVQDFLELAQLPLFQQRSQGQQEE